MQEGSTSSSHVITGEGGLAIVLAVCPPLSPLYLLRCMPSLGGAASLGGLVFHFEAGRTYIFDTLATLSAPSATKVAALLIGDGDWH